MEGYIPNISTRSKPRFKDRSTTFNKKNLANFSIKSACNKVLFVSYQLSKGRDVVRLNSDYKNLPAAERLNELK